MSRGGILFKRIQSASVVSSACVGAFTGSLPQLALSTRDRLQVWSRPSDGSTCERELQLCVEAPIYGGLEYTAFLQRPGNPRGYAIVITADCTCSLLGYNPATDSFEEESATTLNLLDDASQTTSLRRVDGITASEPFYVRNSRTKEVHSALIALSLFDRNIHVIEVNWGSLSEIPTLRAAPLDLLVTLSADLERDLRDHPPNILSLAFCPQHPDGVDFEGNYALAVLYADEPPGALRTVHLSCVAADMRAGVVHPGAWCVRNMHPTTHLLHSSITRADGVSDASHQGIIAFSSFGASLYTAELGLQQKLKWSLTGIPTCATPIGAEGLLVVGDNSGCLTALNTECRPWRCCAITCDGDLTVPSVPPFEMAHSAFVGLTAAAFCGL
eukprot:gene2201-2911_t